jgi:LuxR family transcriptional regulator, maltose regulon positive regulatory protein
VTGPSPAPLLPAKHSVPPRRSGAVARRRLQERLQDAADTRLCVVVAPAGWGKTTLLSHWADEQPVSRHVAWVSLDGSDDEPGRFWTYLLTALHGVTSFGEPALRAVSVPGVDVVGVVLPLLLDELAGASGEAVVILDDYHAIRDRRIHEAVEFLLTYCPPSLRVVLAGRADPPLPLARMRVRGQLTEIRADDLRFTRDESASLVSAVGGVELPQAALSGLWRRTEGWAAGLQLAALAMRGSSRPEVTAAEIRGDDRHILDYLTAEVLEQVDPDHREFLVRTSVLERLSAPLCDAVLRRTGSAGVLRALDGGDLFVVALDRSRRWYRCHGLFRDVLRRELETAHADLVPQLLARAADWSAGESEMDAAIRYRIAAGDPIAAMAALRSSEQWFFERGAAGAYLDLGERLASAPEAADPQVFLMLAYAAALTGRFDRVIRWCDAADPLIADGTLVEGWLSARACLLTMRAGYGHQEAEDASAAVDEGREAAALERDPTVPGYVVSRVALAGACTRAGSYQDAVAVLEEAWSCPSRASLPTSVTLQAAGLFALNLLRLGRLEEARHVCAEVSGQADAAESTWGDAAAASVTWIRLVQGKLRHRAGDAPAARAALARAVALAEVWGRASDLVSALTALAEAALTDGDRPAAREAVTRARDIVGSEPVRPSVARELEAVETRLGRGAVRAARRTGHLHEELTDRELSVLRMLPGSATQREIGEALFLSVNTVKGYTKSLYRKLGAASRAEAVDQGRAVGLI